MRMCTRRIARVRMRPRSKVRKRVSDIVSDGILRMRMRPCCVSSAMPVTARRIARVRVNRPRITTIMKNVMHRRRILRMCMRA